MGLMLVPSVSPVNMVDPSLLLGLPGVRRPSTACVEESATVTPGLEEKTGEDARTEPIQCPPKRIVHRPPVG